MSFPQNYLPSASWYKDRSFRSTRRWEKHRPCCCPNSQSLLFALAFNTSYLPAINRTSVHSWSEVFHVKPEKLTPADKASEPLLSVLVSHKSTKVSATHHSEMLASTSYPGCLHTTADSLSRSLTVFPLSSAGILQGIR